MNWKRIFHTFLEELKNFLSGRAKPKEEKLEDICIDVLSKVNRFAKVGITRIRESTIKEVVSSNLDQIYLITGGQVSNNDAGTGVYRFTKDYFNNKFLIINKKNNERDAHERFFLYCYEELPNRIRRSSTMYETVEVQLIFEKYRYTVLTVLNTITESIKYTNTLGSEEMLRKYMEILDTFFNEVENVWKKKENAANDLSTKETEAVFNSLMESLKFEEEFIRVSKRNAE